MLKVGLVGAGGISGAHIPAWDAMEDTQLTALCDIRPERLEPYADRHCYENFDEMLEKEELDILDICLPTCLHADFAIRAMNRGLHVICEKPISLNREDVRRVYEAAEKNHVVFMVAQVIRFWPEYTALREIFRSGQYGRLLSGNMRRLGSCPQWSWDNWMRDEKRSGLVPYDLHVHDCDFMVYTFGKPQNVISHRSRRPEQDYIHAVYEYGDFFLTAEAAWYAGAYPFGASFRFQFEKAVVEYLNNELTIYEADGTVRKAGDNEDAADTGSINLPKSNAYANEIRYFTDCVKAGKPAEQVKPEELETVIDILNSL